MDYSAGTMALSATPMQTYTEKPFFDSDAITAIFQLNLNLQLGRGGLINSRFTQISFVQRNKVGAGLVGISVGR